MGPQIIILFCVEHKRCEHKYRLHCPSTTNEHSKVIAMYSCIAVENNSNRSDCMIWTYYFIYKWSSLNIRLEHATHCGKVCSIRYMHSTLMWYYIIALHWCVRTIRIPIMDYRRYSFFKINATGQQVQTISILSVMYRPKLDYFPI